MQVRQRLFQEFTNFCQASILAQSGTPAARFSPRSPSIRSLYTLARSICVVAHLTIFDSVEIGKTRSILSRTHLQIDAGLTGQTLIAIGLAPI